MKKKIEFNYYDKFAETACLAKDAIKELKSHAFGFKAENAKKEMNIIHEIENKADDKLHELKTFLIKDFLPPIDREDIIAISHKLDDLVDAIDEVAIDMNIYNISTISPNMKLSISLLETTTEKVYDLVLEMKNFKNAKEIKEKIVEVNNLEERADKLYEKSISELYLNEKDAIEIIKWSSMYNAIEICFDACENIAECVEEVLLKNG